MKFFPLIWAALWRRPARLILTLLAVSVAFTLFGVTIGFNASVQRLVETSRLNLAFVNTRFGGAMPLAYRDQIAQLPGVTKVAYLGAVPGYYQDRKNSAFVIMVGEGARDVMSVFPMSPAQWDQLAASRTGVFISRVVAMRYHLKPGDAFPILTAGAMRQDGSKLWPFTVAGVMDDIPQAPNGVIIGNYAYLDESRPLPLRGTVNTYQFLVRDPAMVGDIAKAVDARFANSGIPTNSTTERAQFESAAQAGINVPFVTTVVAGAGLFMILFLTGNGIAQSVRERIPEFAVLKTLGFTDGAVVALVFVEAAIPCLLGAAIGLGLATIMTLEMPRLMPPNFFLPVPYMSGTVFGVAFVCAALVAFISAALPALRIRRLDVASALSGR